MSGFDWLMIGVVGLSVLTAVAQGFFFELFAFGGMVVGYLLAAWQYGRIAPWFDPYVKSTQVANAVAFLTILFSVMILAGIIGKLARWAVKEVGLHWADRLLGGAFGLVRGMVLASVAVMAVTTFAPDSRWLANSELSRYFLVTARSVSWMAPEDVREKFRHGIAQLRKQQQSIKQAPAAGGLATRTEESAQHSPSKNESRKADQ
jgi:membrane protein required for colicin V production